MVEFAGRKIPNELSEIVAPGRTVLLVWDMQNDQAGGSFNKDALIRNAPPLIAAAASAGVKPFTRGRLFLVAGRILGLIRRQMKTERSIIRAARPPPAELADHGAFAGADDIVIDKRRHVHRQRETILGNRARPRWVGCTRRWVNHGARRLRAAISESSRRLRRNLRGRPNAALKRMNASATSWIRGRSICG
jgi:hypothetical protein